METDQSHRGVKCYNLNHRVINCKCLFYRWGFYKFTLFFVLIDYVQQANLIMEVYFVIFETDKLIYWILVPFVLFTALSLVFLLHHHMFHKIKLMVILYANSGHIFNIWERLSVDTYS